MAGEWSEATIKEVAERVAMGPFGSSIKVETFVSSGVPVISGQHLRGSKVDDHVGFNFVSQEHAFRLKNANVLRGDVIFTHAGNIGQVAFIPESSQFERYVISQRQFYMRCNRAKVLPEFVVAYFKTPEGLHQLLANTSQVGVLSIAQPVTYLRTIAIPLPPLPEQRAIAHILGTLDDKIEVNSRMNETLEAMARALFKSWFVDFDPVRAKQPNNVGWVSPSGRNPPDKTDGGLRDYAANPPYELPTHIADLFPALLVDSELGEIPKGWPVAPLSDCVDVLRGLSYKGSGLSKDGVPMHNLNSIYEGGGYKHDGLKRYEGEYKPQHVARAGDLIVANTEQGHHRLLIGYAAIVPTCFEGQSLFSHHIYRVRPRSSSGLTPDYLCHLLNTSVMHDTVSGYANGTTVNMLPIDGLQSPLVVVPPSVIVRAFDGFAKAARKRHGEMMDESRTLSTLRDTLLPKLISGQLRVKDAERAIEDATT